MEEIMKKKKVWICRTVIFFACVVGIVALLGTNKVKYYTTVIYMQLGKYITNKTIPIVIEDCSKIYVDRRISKGTEVYLTDNFDWLYGCKLYKDFSFTPDTYLVYTNLDYIHANNKNTNAYYTFRNCRKERYIFIWNTTDSSLLHELAHWADEAHNRLSQEKEWKDVYQKEWADNKWLNGTYTDGKLSEEDQLNLYLEESFAEGFAEWYAQYAYEKYMPLRPEEEQFSYIVAPSLGKYISEKEYPLTFRYMKNFYRNYEYGKNTLDAAKYGNVTLEE